MGKSIRAFFKYWLFMCFTVVFILSINNSNSYAKEPIRIGTIFSISGWAGFIGTPQKEIFNAMIEDINSKGGINGRKLELYYEDDKSVPTNAVIAATKLIKDKKVVAMVGTSTSDAGLALVPLCQKEKVPFINTGPAYIPFKKWIICTGPGDVRGATHIIDYAVKDLGAKRVALLHGTDAYGMLGKNVIMEQISNYPGATIVCNESFEVTDTNMIPQLTKTKAAKPDVIILFTTGGAGAVVAKNYKQLGLKTQVLGSTSLTIPEFVNIAGKIAEESQWVFLSAPLLIVDKMDRNDPFRKNVYNPTEKILQKKYGKDIKVNIFHASSYDAIAGIVEAMKMAKNIDRASIRDALEKVHIEGFFGEFAPTPEDHQAAKVDPMRPMVLKNGEWWPYTTKK
ncbi:MAG: ABC transporter substrate-binding protein [Spirochaetes bacterium]|nr:ABC transporter substrate-binding protein [Spirochaetota bacterium]